MTASRGRTAFRAAWMRDFTVPRGVSSSRAISLAALLQDGVPLPPARVVDLITQAGSGLAVLHEQGVVHRDVKPQNLLLRSGGSAGDRLLVADLGVRRRCCTRAG